jgi:hypothetical protein
MRKLILLVFIVLALNSFAFADDSLDSRDDAIIIDSNNITTLQAFPTLKTNDPIGMAIFTVNNTKTTPLDSKNLSVSFNEVCGHVNSYKILIKDICFKTIPYAYNYTTVCVDELISNKTLGTKKVCHNESYVSQNITVGQDCFKELTNIPAGSNDYKIEASINIAKCSDGKLGYKIDWIPSLSVDTVKLTRDDWAWWNVSYTYKRQINCSNMTNGTPALINGTNGVVINGYKQFIWTQCYSNLSLYYNDQASYTVVQNDTTIVPFEVERGNGTSVNPTQVWDRNRLAAVYLLNTSKDSTVFNNGGTPSGVSFSQGILGGGANFAGGTNKITYSDATSINANIENANEISVCVWFKPTAIVTANDGYQMLVDKLDSGFATRMYKPGTGALGILSRLSVGPATYGVWTASLVNNAPTYYCTQWSSGAGNGWQNLTNKSYQTGGGLNVKTGTLAIDTSILTLGNVLDSYGYFGEIADVKIYNQSVSNKTKQDNYNNGVTTQGFGTALAEETNGPTNTCTFTAGQNWMINMTDHCNITSTVNLKGYNVSFVSGTSGDYCNVSTIIIATYFNFTNAGSGSWLKGNGSGYLNMTN